MAFGLLLVNYHGFRVAVTLLVLRSQVLAEIIRYSLRCPQAVFMFGDEFRLSFLQTGASSPFRPELL